MAFDTEQHSVSYAGNNSVVTPYPVPFPFLADASHLRVYRGAVRLRPNEYEAHISAYPTAYITTLAAIPANETLTIRRWLPYAQPVSLREGGPIPASTIEKALDRAHMLALQASLTEDAGGSGSGPVATQPVFANAAERGAAIPAHAGQIASQTSDGTLWIATGTNAGAWESYPRSYVSTSLTLGIMADVGQRGAKQDALADRLELMGPLDALLDCGDNTYSGSSLDWAVFAQWIDSGKYLTVRGNHSIDSPALRALHSASFPTLQTSGKPWWRRELGNGLLTVYGVDSGIQTDGTMIDNLATIGGEQFQWLLFELAACSSPWKIVLIHHPPVSTSNDATDAPEIISQWWPVLQMADAVFCGHTHISEMLNWRGLPVVTAANAVRGNEISRCRPNKPLEVMPLFIEDHDALTLRARVSKRDFVLEWLDVATGAIRHTRSIRDSRPASWEQSHQFPLENGMHHVLSAPGNCRIQGIALGDGSPGASFQIFKNGTSISDVVPFDSRALLTGGDLGDADPDTSRLWLTTGDALTVELSGIPSYSGHGDAIIYGVRFF